VIICFLDSGLRLSQLGNCQQKFLYSSNWILALRIWTLICCLLIALSLDAPATFDQIGINDEFQKPIGNNYKALIDEMFSDSGLLEVSAFIYRNTPQLYCRDKEHKSGVGTDHLTSFRFFAAALHMPRQLCCGVRRRSF
jgi:hypothetical protein